jgi:hypothetical protein
MKKPTNSLIIQCIDTQYSPTCFGTLKCHNQGVKHDPAEIGAQFCESKDGWKLYIVAGGVIVIQHTTHTASYNTSCVMLKGHSM